jgi:hypothetical protein
MESAPVESIKSVCPYIFTLFPKFSFTKPDGSKRICGEVLLGGNGYTYAAPCPWFPPTTVYGAPTTIHPEPALTTKPKLDPAVALFGRRAAPVHIPLVFVKT